MERNKLNMIMNTIELAEVFSVSERQIQRLVAAGVIEPIDYHAHAYSFELDVVVPQYIRFLESGIFISKWAPDTRNPK